MRSGDGAAYLSMPGGPIKLDYSRAKAYSACSRCDWMLFGFPSLSFLFYLLLSGWLPDILKPFSKWPLNPKQPTIFIFKRYAC